MATKKGCPWTKKGKSGRIKSQSVCRICYRAFWDKNDPYDYRLLKRRKKLQQRHLNRILFLFTQKSTRLLVCWLIYFLRSLSDRCHIVTVTCKTNVSSLIAIFSIILSIHPSICHLSITNFNDDILTLVEIKRSSIAPWQNNFSNSSKISEVAAFYQKKQCLFEVGPWRLHHTHFLGFACFIA